MTRRERNVARAEARVTRAARLLRTAAHELREADLAVMAGMLDSAAQAAEVATIAAREVLFLPQSPKEKATP